MNKDYHRKLRHIRVRKKISGTDQKPRLVVFRSNKHFYAQLINDQIKKTIVSISDLELKSKSDNNEKTKKVSISYELGLMIAKKAQAKKINKIVFDKGGYQFHGRVKSFADGARKGGLNF